MKIFHFSVYFLIYIINLQVDKNFKIRNNIKMRKLSLEEIKKRIYPLELIGEYKNNKTKTSFYCSKHNYKFEATVGAISRGEGGCPYCSEYRIDFKKECIKIHGNKYDYSLVDFTADRNEFQTFKCKEHGYFRTTLYCHLYRKTGCPKCSGKYHYSIEEWREYASSLKGDKFDYSLSEYKRCNEKVKIKCLKCGKIFEQTPQNHINQNQGCPYCLNYKREEEIAKLLTEKEISFKRGYKFNDLKDKDLLSYDFYLDEYNLLIEHNGIQHYEKVNWSGNMTDEEMREKLKLQRHHDWLKRKYAKKNGINFLVIKYSDDIIKKLSEELTAFRN